MAVLLFRIDDFHRIHRRVGRLLADRALCLAADIARAEVREADLLARHRGEEFVILAPDASPDAARQLRDRLAEALRCACLQGEGGEVVQFSARFGLVCAGRRVSSRTWTACCARPRPPCRTRPAPPLTAAPTERAAQVC